MAEIHALAWSVATAAAEQAARATVHGTGRMCFGLRHRRRAGRARSGTATEQAAAAVEQTTASEQATAVRAAAAEQATTAEQAAATAAAE